MPFLSAAAAVRKQDEITVRHAISKQTILFISILLSNVKKAKVSLLSPSKLLKLVFDLFKAVLADSLAVEENDIVRVAAEDAGGGVLLKNDSFVINKDLNGILDADVKRTADLNGKNYSSELVDAAYYSGRFHLKIPPKFYILCFVTSL
jgi:hypothetical protein